MSDMIDNNNIIQSDIDVIDINTVSIEDPVINPDKTSFDAVNNTKIYNAELSEDLSYISGYTEEGTKARYIFDKHRWYYGREISVLNFIPITERSPEEQLAIRQKAIKAVHEKQKEKKTLNEIARDLLEAQMSDKMIEEVLGQSKDLLGDRRSAGAVIMVKMMQTAMQGSFKAAEFVRDTAGYKPKNEVELNAEIMSDSDRSLMDKIGKRLELTG